MNNCITEVTNESFDVEVIQSEIPVLVDFWAPWCGPCRTLAPVLETIAENFQGKLKVVKVNVDNNERISGDFAIRSIPTLMIFKHGKQIAIQAGAVPERQLNTFIEKNLQL